jgi:hypothetical protein
MKEIQPVIYRRQLGDRRLAFHPGIELTGKDLKQ